MATYIANKPCRFGGKSYLIGEKIPSDKILPRRIGGLLRMGVIVEGENEVVNPAPPEQPAAPPEPVEQPTEENSKKSKK